MKINLLDILQEEMGMKLKGGLYHQSQVKLTFNSNRIEGSRLSEDQTRYIFKTNTINAPSDETTNVDDIIETVNHFVCFDYMIETAEEPLTEDMIKEFHRVLKTGTDRQLRKSGKIKIG